MAVTEEKILAGLDAWAIESSFYGPPDVSGKSVVVAIYEAMNKIDKPIPGLEEKLRELSKLIKVWWEKHKYDTTGGHGDYNVYDDEPDFVTKAKEIIGDWGK